MNPLWKVFSNFYSKPATLPTRHHHHKPLPGVKWCRHTLQPQTRLDKEDPEACGKVPDTTSVDREPTVSRPSSGLRVRARCQGHVRNILHAAALGRISTAAPETEQRAACTPHCWGPVDMLLHWHAEFVMSTGGGGSKHLSSLTWRHFQMLRYCVPTQWYQVIKHLRGVILIFKTPPTDGVLIINWSSTISVWYTAQISGQVEHPAYELLGDDSGTIYEHSGNLSFSSKIIIIHCCLFLLSTHPAGHEASSFGIISAD